MRSSFAARPSLADVIVSEGALPPKYRGTCGFDSGRGDEVWRVKHSLRGSAGTEAASRLGNELSLRINTGGSGICCCGTEADGSDVSSGSGDAPANSPK